jgi:hypothetical protein
MADDIDELSSFNGLYFKDGNIIDLDFSDQRLADLTSRHVDNYILKCLTGTKSVSDGMSVP